MTERAMPFIQAIDSLTQEIHEVNLANGWTPLSPESWDDRHQLPAAIAMIHTEITEAYEALTLVRSLGVADLNSSSFAEELADIMIRVLDVSGHLDVPIREIVAALATGESLLQRGTTATLMSLHTCASASIEAWRVNDRKAFELRIALIATEVIELTLTRQVNIDLEAAVRAKLEKNRQRGFRHGNKRL